MSVALLMLNLNEPERIVRNLRSMQGAVDEIEIVDRSSPAVHHANYESYLEDKSRAERYFMIENIERPFNRRYLQEALTLRLGGRSVSIPFADRLQDRPDTPLSSSTARGAVEIEFLRDLLMGKGLRAASFNRRYAFRKWRFFLALPRFVEYV